MMITNFWVGLAGLSFPASHGCNLAKKLCIRFIFCAYTMHTCELKGTLIVLLLLLAVCLGYR